ARHDAYHADAAVVEFDDSGIIRNAAKAAGLMAERLDDARVVRQTFENSAASACTTLHVRIRNCKLFGSGCQYPKQAAHGSRRAAVFAGANQGIFAGFAAS